MECVGEKQAAIAIEKKSGRDIEEVDARVCPGRRRRRRQMRSSGSKNRALKGTSILSITITISVGHLYRLGAG